MFVFKKIVALLFFPLSICLEILILGLFFLWFTRKLKTGKIFVSIGVVFLTIISYGTFSNPLLRSLESKYSPITDVSGFQNIKWVAVLGGGHCSDPKLSVTDQLSHTSLVRLIEGIRIQRMLTKSKLILSGGGFFSSSSEAIAMAKLAIKLGIDNKKLIIESKSKDTKDQVNFIHNIIGNERFILFTLALHMAVRSMALFQSK